MSKRKVNKNSENISATESNENEELPVQLDQEEQVEKSSVDSVEEQSNEEPNKVPFVLPQINISIPKQK